VNWELTFVIGSLILVVAVVIGANIWALTDAPAPASNPSPDPIQPVIDQILRAAATQGNTATGGGIPSARSVHGDPTVPGKELP
jgi:hypothetical protein